MYGDIEYAKEHLPEHYALLQKTYAAHQLGKGLDYKTLNQISGHTTDFVDAVGIEFVYYNVSSKSLRVRAVTSLVNNASIDQHLEIFTKAGEAVAGNVSSTPNTTHADISIEIDFDPADFSSSELEISYSVNWVGAGKEPLLKSQIHSLDITEYVFTESPIDHIQVLAPVNIHTSPGSPVVICYGRTPSKSEVADYVYPEQIKAGKQELYIPWKGTVFFKNASTAEFRAIDIRTFTLKIDCGHGSAAYTVDGRAESIVEKFSALYTSIGKGFQYALADDWLDSVPTARSSLADIVNITFAVNYTLSDGSSHTMQISSYADESDDPSLKQISTLRLLWGCLAEGTLILMADGGEKRVEDMRIGDKVIVDHSGQTACVINTWKGAEKEIIQINAAGVAFECSNAHPIRTVDGMKRAYKVSCGDYLVGPHGEHIKVTSVEHVNEERRMYNVDLDNFGTLFANGFMIGDNGVQNSFFDDGMPPAPVFDADAKQALYADYMRFAYGK
jgi:hypothetical protein